MADCRKNCVEWVLDGTPPAQLGPPGNGRSHPSSFKEVWWVGTVGRLAGGGGGLCPQSMSQGC